MYSEQIPTNNKLRIVRITRGFSSIFRISDEAMQHFQNIEIKVIIYLQKIHTRSSYIDPTRFYHSHQHYEFSIVCQHRWLDTWIECT